MSHFFIWKLGALINSVHDFDHKSLQKDIFEVIIRTSAALQPASLQTQENYSILLKSRPKIAFVFFTLVIMIVRFTENTKRCNSANNRIGANFVFSLIFLCDKWTIVA